MFELQKIFGTRSLKSIVFVFISFVVLTAFIVSLYPLVFIVAMTAMTMAGQIVYNKFGGTRCIHCNSRVVSNVRPYHNTRTDVCDTCQMWRSFMANEQERAFQEDITRTQQTNAKAKAGAEAQARARAEERARRQGQRKQTEEESPEPKPEQAFDPYEVLGLIRGASKQEIKAAYHKLMKVYHPDMVAHLGLETQKIAADKALAINRAYEKIGT